MMSRQEIKEEHKRNEGDPRVKMRIRQRARDRIRKAIVKQVKSADVILANPTHVSVALRYRPNEGAPVVVAKGYDDVAMFIREIARKEGIPILESPPLARKLARTVKVGKAIPTELYSAVAEVLAFVYRIRGRVPFS
jgi:flagellar biosynthetic protein FlhB